MKFIKQKSTGKIVHREIPHTDKTLDNAVHTHKIDKADLEVVEENWSNEEWTIAINNQRPYTDKRKAEYDQLNQFELIGEDSINGTTNHKDAILAIKAKYPKE